MRDYLKVFGVGATLIAPLIVGGAILGTTILDVLLDVSERVAHLEAKVEVVLERLPPVGGRPVWFVDYEGCPRDPRA